MIRSTRGLFNCSGDWSIDGTPAVNQLSPPIAQGSSEDFTVITRKSFSKYLTDRTSASHFQSLGDSGSTRVDRFGDALRKDCQTIRNVYLKT